jgi:hypothetical protein
MNKCSCLSVSVFFGECQVSDCFYSSPVVFYANTIESTAPRHTPHPVPGFRHRFSEAFALLRALSNGERQADVRVESDANWPTRALTVYREALAGGYRPSMRILDRLFACLRLPHGEDRMASGDTKATPLKVRLRASRFRA